MRGIKSTYPRRKPIPLNERFWSKVKKTNSCWLWTGCKDNEGYGYFKVGEKGIGYKMILMHRLSWKINKGPIPEGMNVLHKCDVRNCVNPKHLWIGSQFDNNRDRKIKNRGNHVIGENHPQAKLSKKQVLYIRKSYIPRKNSQIKLAKKFNVAHSLIFAILSRKIWKHI